MKRINIQVDASIYDWLRTKAYQEKTSIAKLIRDAIDTILMLEASGNEDKIMTSVFKYTCFKCKRLFELDRDLDTDKPTCNECFKKFIEDDRTEYN